jgi:hypothetical protein
MQWRCIHSFIKYNATETYWEVEEALHAFLASALDGEEWSASRLSCFTLGVKAPGILWIGGCVDTRVGLGAVAKGKNITDTAGNWNPVVQPVP